MQPKLFIGSASESLGIVEALQDELKRGMVTDAWDKSFRPGHYTLEELVTKATEVDFAVFVLGNEDKTESRGNTTISPRDNVVYEAGLFAGHLGIKRVFLMVAKGTKIPTDWKGLGYIAYDPDADAKNESRSAAAVIRKVVKDWKTKSESAFEQQIPGYWWQLVLNTDQGAVVSLMSIKRTDKNQFKINGEAWTTDGKNIAKYWSRAISYDVEDREIFYYWEGEHPYDKTLPRFVGVGEIKFDEDSTTKATGWFSSTPLHKMDETSKKSTKYTRANEADVLIIQGNDRAAIQTLINARCNDLKDDLVL